MTPPLHPNRCVDHDGLVTIGPAPAAQHLQKLLRIEMD